jgi:hypothetical protein
VDRYSFPVRIFHSLLHAGLPRRTNIAVTLTDPDFGEQKAQSCEIACFRQSVESCGYVGVKCCHETRNSAGPHLSVSAVRQRTKRKYQQRTEIGARAASDV